MTQEIPIWRYVRRSEYSVPSEPAAGSLRRVQRSWRAVLAALRSRRREDGEPGHRDRLPEETLASLLPRIDAEELAAALASALEGWPGDRPGGGRARLVLDPPGSGAGEAVAALARRQGWREAELPRRTELLRDGGGIEAALRDLESATAAPTVIPRLGQLLLRNERALPRLRQLLLGLRAVRTPLLIGCDSWSWRFLERTLGVEDLAEEPLLLGALDASRLESWLAPPLRSLGLECRAIERDEQRVFTGSAQPGAGDEPRVSAFLERLAAASRGNPGVALALWRRALRRDNVRSETGEGGPRSDDGTLWVAPVTEAQVGLPQRLELLHEFVLHAVLVHGGLEREVLPEVLPFPRDEISRRLRDLRGEGLVSEDEDRLTISLAAYPAVRLLLDSEGFLVDEV